MDTNKDYILWAEQYLRNQLTQEEKEKFESELAINTELAAILEKEKETHELLIAYRRTQIKAELEAVQQKIKREKGLKRLVLLVLALAIIGGGIYYFFPELIQPIQEPIQPSQSACESYQTTLINQMSQKYDRTEKGVDRNPKYTLHDVMDFMRKKQWSDAQIRLNAIKSANEEQQVDIQIIKIILYKESNKLDSARQFKIDIQRISDATTQKALQQYYENCLGDKK